MSDRPDEAMTGLQAAVAVVTARLHAQAGHGSMADALAVQAALYEELGEDLVTSLSSLTVGIVELSAVLNDLVGKSSKSPAELLQIVALRLSQQGL